MILPVNNFNKIPFSANNDSNNKLEYTKDTLLKNNFTTRTRIGFDKLTNALTLYPAKGFKGSKNANFYEFLTMGTVPYLVGSGMLMAVFNSASKYYTHYDKSKAAKIGKKMALGVVAYGVIKELSKTLITKPVKMLTGVDTELPYAKVIYELPEDINDTDIISIEYHKIFESSEFPRWDLLYGDEAKGQKRNFYYDKVSKKLGLGENLNDSDQEVKPLIKEIVVKSNTAKNISSYLWAAAGVGLAMQEPWDEFFKVATPKFWKRKEFGKTIQAFFKGLGRSINSLYNGQGKGIQKHAGKGLIYLALLSSVAGVINVLNSSNKPSKMDATDFIKKDGKYVVN